MSEAVDTSAEAVERLAHQAGVLLLGTTLGHSVAATLRALSNANAQLERERDALAAFKAYAHQRMDEAGIPTHPEGEHSAQGCRIGDRFDLLVAQRDAAIRERDAAREAKDGAYLERNRLVAVLASIFPSVRCLTAIEGWSEDWHGCVYITLPTGQASWHYHDSHAFLFGHVPEGAAQWDGHSTDEKYRRVAVLAATAQGGE